MDWYRTVLLVMSVVVVAFSPFLIAKALRRKEKRRIYDIVLSALFIVYLTVEAFWPGFFHRQVAPIRWLVVALLLLWGANVFGLSYWLFKEPRKANSTRP